MKRRPGTLHNWRSLASIPSPKSLHDDHWLVGLLGRETAEKLCRDFVVHHPREHRGTGRSFLTHNGAGANIELPKGQVFERLARYALVRDMTIGGKSKYEIAMRLGSTSRNVTRVRAVLRAAGEIP